MDGLNQFFQTRAAEMWIGLAFLVLILEVWIILLHRRLGRMQAASNLRQRAATGLASAEDHEAVLRLQEVMQTHLQKIGMVRFNPFGDTGGDQSFALCLADAHGNGVVLSCLNRRTESKVYAKPLAAWQSKYSLSTEEQQAMGVARGDVESA